LFIGELTVPFRPEDIPTVIDIRVHSQLTTINRAVYFGEPPAKSLLSPAVRRTYDGMVMTQGDDQARRELQQLDRPMLRQLQLSKLNAMLDAILPENAFYANKLRDAPFPLTSLDQLGSLPFTHKHELLSGSDPWAANRTWPIDRYARYHCTSGTKGRPMVVLDTADDWNWWIETWQFVLDAANVTSDDRAFMAFSFGPFIGFWSANDALVRRGAMVVAGGGLSTVGRLETLLEMQATVVCCTPTYALHMAEVAAAHGMPLRQSQVRAIIVAGEPGGSIPTVRQRIETVWGAEVVDHAGATEIGPWGFADRLGTGLHVVESEFIAEFLRVDSGGPAQDGELSELLLTSLGRYGCPVIRYRTGDLVRPAWKRQTDSRFVWLEGGVLGRADDMLVIRGVNVFPTSVERIVRQFPEIAEFRVTAFKSGEMDDMRVEIEDAANNPRRVAKALQLRLGLRVEVKCVEAGSLPRFEAKGKRFVDRRKKPGST
jgi:phenylacetate-CoA ligase